MKQTVIDQIEVQSNGIVQVRLALLIVEDGEVLAKAWHRTSIEPGTDVEAQLAHVDAHLAQMKRAPVDRAGVDRLKAIVAAVHTPEVIKAFRSQLRTPHAEI